MSNVKVELNSAGVRALLKSQEMQQICSERAKEVCSRCGSGYATDIYVGRSRANAMIYPESAEATRDNQTNNTILKALK